MILSLKQEPNPIQKQIISMIIVHLQKSDKNSCDIRKKDNFTTWNITDHRNLNEFNAIDILYNSNCGFVTFLHHELGTINFKYCFEQNKEEFQAVYVPDGSIQYVYDLFCEAEFLLNIDFHEQIT
jgi:hypothetical protein